MVLEMFLSDPSDPFSLIINWSSHKETEAV